MEVSSNWFSFEACCECTVNSGFICLFIFFICLRKKKRSVNLGVSIHYYEFKSHSNYFGRFTKAGFQEWLQHIWRFCKHTLSSRDETVKYPGQDVSIAPQDVCLQAREERNPDLKLKLQKHSCLPSSRRECGVCSTGLLNRP